MELTEEQLKKIVKNIDISIMESRDAIFYAGVRYLAELLTNPKRQDNYKVKDFIK